jgi:sialic acid synthase SpsE
MKLNELIRSYDGTRILPIDNTRPYLIAEAGVNHEADMELARRLVFEAAEGGADAIKFQTYKAETIASKDSPSYWDLSLEPTTSQYKLFKKYDKFWKKEFEILARVCEEVGIEFLSTPFDVESATFLNNLMDVFKISSSDLNNRPFIEFMCDFGKPVILSTGASWLDEVKESVGWIQAKGNDLALLHCILNYPTADENANLAMIATLQAAFPDVLIGYSDHTLPRNMKTLEIASLLGAGIIEKHFTHDKTLPGNDHYHAMDKEDIKVFRQRMQALSSILGSGIRKPIASEEKSRANARRSLVAARPIARGQPITAEDITWKRPAHGIDPKEYSSLVGRTSNQDINEDTVLQWEMFDV